MVPEMRFLKQICILYTCFLGQQFHDSEIINIIIAIQAATIPTILSGGDAVVAAETGSGKTHGYLVPIIHKLCSNQDVLHDLKQKKNGPVSLVLCPNVMLCEQVVRMANSLCDDTGEPLVKAAAIISLVRRFPYPGDCRKFSYVAL